MYFHDFEQHRVNTSEPINMKAASGFLWNKNMMLHVNCRGYAVGQFMQPEPSKYSHAPNLAAQTFMQPEQGYFSHHSGRFFYIKCLDSGKLFSIPYEPVKKPFDSFLFSVGKYDLSWSFEVLGLQIELQVSLPKYDVVELWTLKVTNSKNTSVNFAIYPYFTIGYMSWMNQSADFDHRLNAIIGNSITPYQKVEEYFKNQHRADKTYFISKHTPDSWNANQASVEGEGGLHNPDDLQQDLLSQEQALYQQPVACMQFNHQLQPNEKVDHSFIFGPAKNNEEISQLKAKYIDDPQGIAVAQNLYKNYLNEDSSSFCINTNNKELDEFINHWLPRQVFYHGDVNRLTTDPQTRNYLQDAMGMAYLSPAITKNALITALAQQNSTGSMPDGILLHPEAELKYINQIPHSDHGVWLTLCLQCYLNESNDEAILYQKVSFKDCEVKLSVIEHINLALDYLLAARDERGLSYIEQGDWCDPMNMVGYKGKGVSAWLTMATAYSLKVWCDICSDYNINQAKSLDYQDAIKALNKAINTYFWDGDWYARGITDDNVTFGTQNDAEGKIFLNPQSWAMLAQTSDHVKNNKILYSIEKHLNTPFGPMMLAPAFTKMREDIGRVTQKFPGVAENGSVYNHAAAFYLYSLLQINRPDEALEILEKMLPVQSDANTRKQLPTFIPNYYRGAFHQLPNVAGCSSQLFNTGTVAWVYRCIIEEFCGLKGHRGNLLIAPKVPNDWISFQVSRQFMGAKIHATYQQKPNVKEIAVYHNNQLLLNNTLNNIKSGKQYQLSIILPSVSTD